MPLSFPSSPINGAVAGDYTYDAAKTAWRKNGAYPVSVTHSDVAPSNPRVGDQWWKSNEGTLFTYYYDGNSYQWVESTNVIANVEPNPIPAGAMMAWASDVIPANWLLCDGTAVSRSTYASLFAIIGTTYGSGDGSTTFNLPNLKGRTIVGKDGAQTEFDVLGETGGAKTHTLTQAEMPSHTHTQDAHAHTFSGTTSTAGNHSHTTYGVGGFNSSGAGYLALQSDGNLVWYRGNGTTWASGQGAGGSRTQVFVGGDQSYSTSGNGDHSHTYSGTTSSTTATNQSTGGGGAHNNLQPYIVLNYIIKYSAGETPGDSQLAVRVGALETNVRSVAVGGTGTDSLTFGGYLKGAGTSAITAQTGIPAGDITSGALGTAYGGTGAATGAGFVPVIASSISVGSGTASLNTTTGRITCTGATNLLVNGVFTSTYRNYLIVMSLASSGPNKHQVRFSSGGSINSSTNYTYTDFYVQAGGTGASGTGTSQNIATMLYGSYVNYWVYDPAIASYPTQINADGIYSHTRFIAEGGYNAAAAFDGIWLANNSLTGQVMVYGLRD